MQGLPTPTGGKIEVLNGAGFEDPGNDIGPVSTAGTSVYASFILNVVNPGGTTGDYFVNFASAGTAATGLPLASLCEAGKHHKRVPAWHPPAQQRHHPV